MKAEHRKELETNTLADKLGGVVQSFKEGPSTSTVIFGSVVVLVILLILVFRWVSSNAEASDSARWMKWNQLNSQEELEAFAKENADKVQGRLARFELARLDLVAGLRDLGSPISRGEAVKRIQRAATAYEALATESSGSPRLAQEALLNAAKAQETLGNLDKAKAHYKRLASEYPQSLKGKDAADQLKELEAAGSEMELLKQLAEVQKNEPLDRLPPVPSPMPDK